MGSLAFAASHRHARMSSNTDYDRLNDALKRAGSSWDAAQAHGLLAGKLAVCGAAAGPDWVGQVLEGTDPSNALRKECEALLNEIFQSTERHFSERLSQFMPLLPNENESRAARTEGIGHWSEGYLHGLVSSKHGEPMKKQLAAEPIAGIIKDLLAITQATVEDDSDREEDEAAYTEIVEYIRVAAQVVYEELAPMRPETLK